MKISGASLPGYSRTILRTLDQSAGSISMLSGYHCSEGNSWTSFIIGTSEQKQNYTLETLDT